MRLLACLIVLSFICCAPSLYGTWVSHKDWVSFGPDHKFQTGAEGDSTTVSWYTVKTYDWSKKKYVDKVGPGKDTLYFDRIYMLLDKDTVPYFEYLLRRNTLLLNAFGDSTGTIYIRKR